MEIEEFHKVMDNIEDMMIESNLDYHAGWKMLRQYLNNTAERLAEGPIGPE